MRVLRREENAGLPSVLNLQVEPVATFESTALQSSWIQRLKPAPMVISSKVDQVGKSQELPMVTGKNGTLDYGHQLWDQIHMLKLSSETTTTPARTLPELKPEPFANFVFGQHELNPRVPVIRNGTFRPNFKCKKPPLFPSSRSGCKASAKDKGKNKVGASMTQWKVRTLDLKVDNVRENSNKNLFAEFASRLEIKEVGSGSSSQAQEFHQQKQDNLFATLTPVVSPAGIFVPLKYDNGFNTGFKGSTATASLTRGVLELCKLNEPGATFRSNSSHCASSPFPSADVSMHARHGSMDTDPNCAVVLSELKPIVSNANTNEAFMKKKRANEEMNSEVVKRSRLEPTATKDIVFKHTSDPVPLSGIWLQRWNPASVTPLPRKKTSLGPKLRRPEELAPSAAAVVIAGNASKHLNGGSWTRRKRL